MTTTTTNVEKLVYHVFDRTNWIVQQVKQQTYLYQQNLASNLLIQGINPPPCFLNPNSHSLSSHPRELNKEELISDLLLPPARPDFPYSTGQCFLQSRQVVSRGNVVSLDELPKDIHNSNDGIGERDEPVPVHESHDYDVRYNSNCVPRQSCKSSHDQGGARAANISIESGQSQGGSQMSQQAVMQDSRKVSDGSVTVVNASDKSLGGCIVPMDLPDNRDTDLGFKSNSVPKCSPADQNIAGVSNMNIAPDESLVKFQRSKSRQKALEFRTSAKAKKSRFSHENEKVSFSGVALYGIDLEEPDHSKDLLVMTKSSDTNKKSSVERVTSRDLSNKIGTSYNPGRITRSKSKCRGQSSDNEPLNVDVSHENVRKNSGKESCVMRQAKGIDQGLENGAGGYCGQIRRSKSSCVPQVCLNASFENGSSSAIQYKNGNELFQCMDNDNLLVSKKMEVVIPFHSSEKASDLRDAAMEKCNRNMPDGSNHKDLSDSKIILPVTETSAISSKEEKVPSTMDIELQGHPPCFKSTLDNVNYRKESEVPSVRLASDTQFVVLPKQLDFDVLKDYKSNEHYIPPSVMKIPEQSSQRTCLKLLEPETSLEKSKSDYPSNVSSNKQLKGKSGASKGKTKTQRLFETNMEDCNEDDRTLQPYLIENLHGTHTLDDSEAGLYIYHFPNKKDVSPSHLRISSYLDVHQSNNHVMEGCPEQRIDEGLQQECSGSSPMPCLTKLATEDPESCLDRDENMKNKPDDVFDARRCFKVDDENNLLQHKHTFGCKNVENLVDGEKMALALGCFNSNEEGLNISGSVGDTQDEDNNFGPLGFGETQPTYRYSLSKNRSMHTKADSWPQFKRRKIDDHQTNGSSASPSFRVQRFHDIQVEHISSHSKTIGNVFDTSSRLPTIYSSHQHNTSESFDLFHEKMECHLMDEILSLPMLKRQRVEGSGFDEQIKVLETPCTSEDEELGPCLISSLSKQATKDLQGSFVEDYTISYPARHILAANDLRELHKFQNVGNADDPAVGHILTSTRSALIDSNSHLKVGNTVGSPCNKELAFDQNLPVNEEFVLNEHSDNGEVDTCRDGIDFGELNTTCNSMQRASILERICRTASMCTPSSHFSSTYKPIKNKDLFVSLPNGLLEHTNITCTLPFGDDASNQLRGTSTDEVDSAMRGMQYSDCLPYSGAQYGWNSNNSSTPPCRKYCERIPSKSMSSEKLLGSNPELTCFPIQEDPIVDDENENANEEDDSIQEDVGFAEMNSCAKGEALLGTEKVLPNPPASISQTEKYHHIGDLHSSNAEVLSCVKQRLRNHCSNKKSKIWGKENQLSSVGSESLQNRFTKAKLSSTSMKRGSQRLSEKVKHKNIVSNVTSFIPLVQQKQAAAVSKGKRKIKVRALEAAEVAKRLEEKKENERKNRKDALKLERAKTEQETLRQRELDRGKKVVELKKKGDNIAASKRLREEEFRKEKERKGNRIRVGGQALKAQEEKVFARKVEKENQFAKKGKSTYSRKESNNRIGKDLNVDIPGGNEKTLTKSELQTETKTTGCNVLQVSIVSEDCETLSDCDGSKKLTSMLNQSPLRSGVATNLSQEKSYEMSPYQDSDGEEEDESPSKKFIPSWASESCVAPVLPSQQQIDPSVLFPRGSFCRIDEAVLPRRLL